MAASSPPKISPKSFLQDLFVDLIIAETAPEIAEMPDGGAVGRLQGRREWQALLLGPWRAF
jgi:hypothetical protein